MKNDEDCLELMTDHYGVRSQFEAWVVGLVGRELLGDTAWGSCGLAHQFQHGGGDVPVDCPPVDWWLFLFPEGIVWSALAIERKVEKLAAMDLRRLPGPKVEALLQVADAVTEYYGIGDRLEAWAERIPVQEAFAPQSESHCGVLSAWQPSEPVSGAGSPLDWWLFLSPAPIEWDSFDDLPIHALVAHVSDINFHEQRRTMHRASSAAWHLLRKVGETEAWPRLARMEPLDAVRLLNEAYASIPEGDR